VSDKKLSFDGVSPLGPIASPRPPANDDDTPRTDPGLAVSAGYVQRKVAEAVEQAHDSAWKAGWAAGIVGVGIAVGLAFGGWFKIEAMAQEKSDRAVERADAGAEQKLGSIRTDIAVLKNDVSQLKEASKRDSEQHEEIIRLLKARK
jgi:hypothetical protein